MDWTPEWLAQLGLLLGVFLIGMAVGGVIASLPKKTFSHRKGKDKCEPYTY